MAPSPTIHRPQWIKGGLSFWNLCLFTWLSVGKYYPIHSFHFISFISNSKKFAVNSFHSFQFPRMIPDLQVGLLWPAQWQFLRITLHLRTGSGVISAYNFTKLWNVRAVEAYINLYCNDILINTTYQSKQNRNGGLLFDRAKIMLTIAAS